MGETGWVRPGATSVHRDAKAGRAARNTASAVCKAGGGAVVAAAFILY
jgi:hypothetical protein